MLPNKSTPPKAETDLPLGRARIPANWSLQLVPILATRVRVQHATSLRNLLTPFPVYSDPAEPSATKEGAASSEETVRLWTVDALFGSLWAGERLGFAHLDLEGMEIDALRGAAATLARDRPVLTVEVWTHTKDKATHDKLSHLASLNCDTYVIDEVAGVPFDVRNLLCVPREANLTTRPLPAKSWCRPIVSFRTCFRAVRYGAPAAATLALAAVSTWKP